jgi:hypothetical protein
LRLLWLGCLIVAGLVAPVPGAAEDDPGFCGAIQDVLQASRTDFSRWRGTLRGSSPPVYDAQRTLPRASDCRIESSGGVRYTCDWEYASYEEASARAAADRFLDGIVECLGDHVLRVDPYTDGTTGRRHTTLLIQDGAASHAEVRVGSWRSAPNPAWHVEFVAGRRKPDR